MEQVFSGEYGIWTYQGVFIDHARTQRMKKYEYYPIVMKGDRVTEEMREDGVVFTVYIDDDDISK